MMTKTIKIKQACVIPGQELTQKGLLSCVDAL